VGLEHATVLTVASLANTGPIIEVAPAAEFDLVSMLWHGKLILCGAMVLGRLELLAVIVMISPEVWRS
jgi:trk system potassium uptake protein TrkH